ncbi:MAG: peroxiredoxin family protein [Pseudobdellovibrionaceae bacterium]
MSDLEKLKIGSPAPDFEFTLTRGNTMSLSHIAEKGPVLVNFIKGTWNPQYVSYIRNLRRWQATLGKKNVTLVVISSEKVETLRESTKGQNLDFLFGSANDIETFAKFGIHFEKNDSFIKPATFLIETDMTVRLMIDEVKEEASAPPAKPTA